MLLGTLALLIALTPQAEGASLKGDLTTRTPVLVYHDMVPVRDKDALWFDCTPKELEAQLDWLAHRGAKFVSIDQLSRHMREGSGLPARAVAITFADNYLGFYKFALPILRKRKVPVTMFVHTGHVGSMKGRPKMNWDQLRELDREGLVTIASQTVSHPADLTKLSDQEVFREFRESKLTLEKQLGHPVPYLAYPNGKHDRRVASLAEWAEYSMAFTEAQKPAEEAVSAFMVARTVHTRYRQAWEQAKGAMRLK